MYYFLTGSFTKNSAGIEHAQVNRLKLFREHGKNSAILTVSFNRFLHSFLHDDYGLEDEEFINLYDYFGDSVSIEELKITINDITTDTISGQNVYAFNRKIMSFTQFDNGNLNTVNYFDGDGILVQRDCYDSRGYKSLIQLFAKDEGVSENSNWLSTENFYSPVGRLYFTKNYRKRGKSTVLTNMILTDLDGKMNTFLNEKDLYSFFLNKLVNESQDVLMSDRSNITNLPMLSTNAKKIECFHSIHFRDSWNSQSPLTYNSISQTELLSKLDLIVTPTPEQATDMRSRLRTSVPITNVSVGISELQKKVPASSRIKGKIVAVARIFYEKHLDAIVRAVKQVHNQIPGITLDIYGYPDGTHKELDKLNELISELDLQEIVTLKGYQADLSHVYDEAELLLVSSRYEGFCLAILEAMSHGVPTVGFRAPYGTNYLIQNDQNGYILDFDDIDGMAERTKEILDNSLLLERLSKGAYARAADFDKDAVWNQWENALKLVEKQ